MCEACSKMVDHNKPYTEICPIHNRWILINRADGTMAERRCPECPRWGKPLPPARKREEG